MSKSRGNVQDPDELVSQYGADTVRLFLMFMGPWDQGGPWSPTGIGGVARFIGRAWTLTLDPHGTEPGDPASGSLPGGEDAATAERAIRGAAHRTLATVTADFEAFRFNTMVARLMELSNLLFRYRGSAVAGGAAWDEAISLLLLMLAPAAPHVTEELWSRRLAARGEAWRSIHLERWPEVDACRGRRRDAGAADPGQRQGPRSGRDRGRALGGRGRGARPGPSEGRGRARREGAGPRDPRRRRAPGEHRRAGLTAGDRRPTAGRRKRA